MNNITNEQLASIIASYLKANKIAVVGFEASKDNVLGLVDKIGKTITIDGLVESNLSELDGENLPLGKTIEEYFLDFLPPKDYVKNAGIENVTAVDPVARPVRYSYTQGRKKWSTTEYFNDLEKAFSTMEGATSAISKIVERLSASYLLWREDVKKELLGQLATRATEVISKSETFATSKAYAIGAYVNNGSEYGIVFNAIDSSNAKDWATCVKEGYIAVVDLASTIAEPTDTATGEEFIKAVKKYARKASFKNHENLNGSLILPTPKASRVLIINTYLMPSIEVDTLAGAFNRGDLAMPVRVIETDSFGSNSDCMAILMDIRGVKLHNSYNATFSTPLGDDGAIKYVKHTEDTGFISANTFVHVFNKK